MHARLFPLVVAFLLPTSAATVVFAQSTGAPADTGGASGGASSGSGGSTGGSAPSGGATGATGGAAAPAPQVLPLYPAPVAPAGPGTVLGGGNVGSTSSSKPKYGDEEDHFDLGPRGGGGGTAYGSENGPVFMNGSTGSGGIHMAGGAVPNTHAVRRGDTLWGICDFYFQNPYQWPRIWSYNPQLQNPHWIYPGDQVRLKGDGIAMNDAGAAPAGNGNTGNQGGLIDRRRQVPNDTIFLRDQGFIDDSSDADWGEITGAPVDKMFLTDTDEIYLRVGGKRDVGLGQELTIFRNVRNVPGGQLVQIQGTVKIDQWNAKDRIARGRITESLDAIERGARIGPVQRKFIVAPPKRNVNDVHAHVIASVHQHVFYGQNQVVFIDQGEKEGLSVGNRLFVIRKGDAWGESLATQGAATRIAIESDSPAEVEKVPTPRDPKRLPEEVVGELRVVAVRDHSAACVVTQSRKEIEVHDDLFARKGY